MLTALSIALHEHAYNSARDYLPPQFSNQPMSRYAFRYYVIERRVPRSIRLKYVYSAILACFGAMSFTILFFVWDSHLKPIMFAVMAFWVWNALYVVKRFRDNDRPAA
jgi:hypothetical protein